jgi:uncharacterized protein (DUF427 family)
VKATINGTVIAEAAESALVPIEGNWYFPPSAVTGATLRDSATLYICPWKGRAQYHDVIIDGNVSRDAAWSYPVPKASAIDTVGSDFAGYVAFDPLQVDVGP